MQSIFIEYIYLIFIIVGLIMLAGKLRTAYPIVLVLDGLALSFTNIFPHITIDPELIFFIFLPPLLYEAAWQTSWKEFWKWRRVIDEELIRKYLSLVDLEETKLREVSIR
jgi:CPA1 family monovalent cation:H+ antiporter